VTIVLAAFVGYLLGAIPTGLLVGRVTRGIDIREYGSHRTGSANALRTLGRGPAALVFALDLGKGLAAVLLARFVLPADSVAVQEWAAAAAGIAAIVGHNWSVFMGFTGGRGVATSAGALLGVAPWAVLVTAPLVLFIIWRWRYSSLGSISGALLAPVVVGILAVYGAATLAGFAYALAAGVLVTASHSDNIARLRAGTERKIGQKEQVATHG
jgi:glycerol-3-phosphate acyltransferase PlsY